MNKKPEKPVCQCVHVLHSDKEKTKNSLFDKFLYSFNA